MRKQITISFTEGRVVRDLLWNNLPEILLEQGYEILFLTPAARVPQFTAQWSRPGIDFYPLRPYQLDVRGERALRMRRILFSNGKQFLGWWRKIEPKFFELDQEYANIIRGSNLVVITHPMFHSEIPVFRAAFELGIPTLGILRSWDNLHKGLRIYTDILAVWNQVNQEEACRLMGYDMGHVKILGGMQFDPYFAPDANWSRAQFARALNLDPERPIITLAMLGAFLHQYDESYLVEILLDAIRTGAIRGKPQLVLRLHPASKLEYFSKYMNLPDVRVSYAAGYIPTLGWSMSRDDVIFMANLLRHSDVVVSPGSTITIETAIFDTPTVVPIFHTYQPELGKEQFDHHLRMHFKRLAELDLIPIIRRPEDLVPAINHCLSDRSWYKTQRAQLVRDYIHFTDGHSTERLVELIEGLCHAPTAIA